MDFVGDHGSFSDLHGGAGPNNFNTQRSTVYTASSRSFRPSQPTFPKPPFLRTSSISQSTSSLEQAASLPSRKPQSVPGPELDNRPGAISTQEITPKVLRLIKAIQDFYRQNPDEKKAAGEDSSIDVDVATYEAFRSSLQDSRVSDMLPNAAGWTYDAKQQKLTPTQVPSFPHEAPSQYLSTVVREIGDAVQNIARRRFPRAHFTTYQSSTSRLKAVTDRTFHDRQPDNGLILSYRVNGQPMLTHPPVTMEVGVSDGKKKLKRVTWAWLYGSYEVEVVILVNVISPRKDARSDFKKWRAYLETWCREIVTSTVTVEGQQNEEVDEDDSTVPIPTADEVRALPDLTTDEDVEELLKKEKKEAEASVFSRDRQKIRRLQRIEILNVEGPMEPLVLKLSQLIGSTTLEDLREADPSLEDQEFRLETETLRDLLENGIAQMAQRAVYDAEGQIDIPRVAQKRPLSEDILADKDRPAREAKKGKRF